uniref:Uncharacterized protein n=1 Tax=Anguilla anguilla TaxID=7936 RepID=A0A0E9RU76_ANGAN
MLCSGSTRVLIERAGPAGLSIARHALRTLRSFTRLFPG